MTTVGHSDLHFFLFTCRPSQPEVDINSLQSSLNGNRTRPNSTSTTLTPDQPDLGELWIEKRSAGSVSSRISNFESFDLYIDEVRFIPDNATIIKVAITKR
jgi:hypothetical protein